MSVATNRSLTGIFHGRMLVDDACCEVIFGDNAEHRADILGAENTVIEIQRSVIDIRDSRDRVEFYRQATGRRVVWVVDIREFWNKRFFLKKQQSGPFKVEWKPRRSWLWDLATTPDTNLYLEFNHQNDKLIHAWIHQGEMYARYLSKEEFFMHYLNEVSLPVYRDFSEAAFQVLTDSRR